jgi:hypothetical protein
LREQGYLFALTGSFFRVNREFFTLTGIGSPGPTAAVLQMPHIGALIAWAIAGVGMLMLAFVFQTLSKGGHCLTVRASCPCRSEQAVRGIAQPILQRPAGGHRPHQFALDRRIAAKYDPHVSRSPVVERFAP